MAPRLINPPSLGETYRVIKQFHWEEGIGHDPFKELVFSDSTQIRLSRTYRRVILKRQSSTYFPTTADIYFRTWNTTPLACRQLLMLQTFPNIQPTGTSIGLRIYNGTSDYYWNGAAWAVAGAGNWNTEADINAHLSTFPILPGRTFAVTVNLVTTDNTVSPYITEIRVLMSVNIDFLDDIVHRSLIPKVKADLTGLTAIASIPAFTTSTTTIDLDDYRRNSAYTITTVTQVYDLDADPSMIYNLFSSYNTTTHIITLSPALPANHRPFIIARYAPEFSYVTHQDYVEVAKVPALVLQKMEVPISQEYSISSREAVIDRATYVAVVQERPWLATLQFRLHGLTPTSTDEMRMITAVLKFFEANKTIRMVGLDEFYPLYITKEFRDMTNPNRSDQRAFWVQFEIQNFRMPLVSTDAFAVRRITVSLAMPGIDPATGTTISDDDSPVLADEDFDITI